MSSSSSSPKVARSSSSPLVLPVLFCLLLLLWQNCCHAKSPPEGRWELLLKREEKNSQRNDAYSEFVMNDLVVKAEKEEKRGEEEEKEEEVALNTIFARIFDAIHEKFDTTERSRQWLKLKQNEKQEKEEPFHVNFGLLRSKGLHRSANSYSILEMEELGREEEKEKRWKQRDDEHENEELVVPWFGEWERMARREGKKANIPPVVGVERSTPLLSLKAVKETPRFRNIRGPCLLRREKPSQHRTYPRSYEFPGFEASIPREWDWRNVNGINFCSPNRNQHIPVYCGGCWVFGSLGSLNDRFNIARRNRWPMTNISPQEIIACNGRGSCNGGTAEDVFEHAKTVGLVEEGCNNFKAVNEKCTPFTRCGSCWPDNCFSIKNYTRYYIKDFGKLTGREQMMSEIHNRGPISCTVGCTPPFDLNYTHGIYREFGDFPPNHIVSVSGWGWDEESKTEYWIVRNSWGDAWGENGWFRIVTSLFNGGRGDQYNMGIERECYFADPDVSNLG